MKAGNLLRIETTLCVIAAALAVSGSVGLCFLALAKQRAAAEESPAAYHDRLNGQFGRTIFGRPVFIERLDDADKSSARSVPRPEDTK